MDVGVFILTTYNFEIELQDTEKKKQVLDYIKLHNIKLWRLVDISTVLARIALKVYSEQEKKSTLRDGLNENNPRIADVFGYTPYYGDRRHKKMFMYVDFDPYDLIEKGYVPELLYYYRPDRSKFLSFVNDLVPESTVNYFFGTTIEEHLKERKFWIRYTKKRAERDAKDANALGIMFSYPEMLYSSLHPKTDMSLFRSESSLQGVVKDNMLIINNIVYEIGVQALPVTRYSACIEAGLYHSEISCENTRCGTYYYHEPESTTYLLVGRMLVARTKTSACSILAKTSTDREFTEYLERYNSSMPIQQRNYEIGKYKKDMRYTPIEAHKLLAYKGIGDPYSVPQVPIYLGASPLDGPEEECTGLYAIEDDLDIPMCLEARRQGYDTILLTEMIGAFKVVTELVDVRLRVESLKSLVWSY